MANHISGISLARFSPQELSITLWAFAKCGVFDQNLFEKVGTHILQLSLKQWKPQEISNTMWAYATADITGQAQTYLFEKVADHIAGLKSLTKFSSQSLSSILWACATCDIYHRGLFNRVMNHIVGLSTLDRFEPVALSNILWAYARMYIELALCHKEEGFHQLFQKIACHLLEFHNYNQFEEVHLSKIVCAYANAEINYPRLFQRFSLTCIQRREEFTPRSIASILWAFAYMNMIERELFLSFLPSVMKNLDNYNVMDLVTVAWAYAVAEVDAPNLFNQQFLDACVKKERDLDEEHLRRLHQWHLWQTKERSRAGLPQGLRERCHKLFISGARTESRFQQSILSALSSIGLESKKTILESGYGIDALVVVNGRTIGLEVSGNFHFIGQTRSLRGSTILKRRQISAVDNIEHISVPHWEWSKLGNDLRKRQGYLRNILAAPRVPRAPTARLAHPNGAIFVNTNFNPIFKAYRFGCRFLKDRIGADTNPLPDLPLSRIGDGKPMCLAFHAKGVCNPNCGRLADHVPYTTAQYEELKNWCERSISLSEEGMRASISYISNI